MGARAFNLQNIFEFGEDPFGIYPFHARCLAAKFPASRYPTLLELGRLTVDYVMGRRGKPSRQIKHGRVILYFPERWLAAGEKRGLMSAFVDVHETHPLQAVHIITGEPIIVSDFAHTLVRSWG